MKPRHLADLLYPAAVVALALWLAAEHQLLRARTSEFQFMQMQVYHMSDLASQNQRLSNQLAAGSSPERLPQDQFMELLRLRGEAGALKQSETDLDKARKENQFSLFVLARYLQSLVVSFLVVSVV